MPTRCSFRNFRPSSGFGYHISSRCTASCGARTTRSVVVGRCHQRTTCASTLRLTSRSAILRQPRLSMCWPPSTDACNHETFSSMANLSARFILFSASLSISGKIAILAEALESVGLVSVSAWSYGKGIKHVKCFMPRLIDCLLFH